MLQNVGPDNLAHNKSVHNEEDKEISNIKCIGEGLLARSTPLSSVYMYL